MNPLLILFGLAGASLVWKGQEVMDNVAPLLPSWNKFDAWFKWYAAENQLPANGWKWLKAICLNESSLGDNPLVKAMQWSSDGLSRGIMQLTVATANDYEKWSSKPISTVKRDYPSDYEALASLLDDPETSIRISAKHFARIYRKFNGVLEHAVKAYNQGEGNQAKEIALRASLGVPATGYSISQYPAAATYWARFEKNLSRVESKQ